MNYLKPVSFFLFFLVSISLFYSCQETSKTETPNIILIMTDDQGWGQTGYYDHPVLKTPNLDEMAANGLRLDRFYAGAPVCSPTRASVLTGRTNDRTGVFSHGYALREQEKTIAEALKNAGYATGHFGKWHLNGLQGPGVPIFAYDKYSPGAVGFEKWVSVTNFFDVNPLMSDNGEFNEYQGTSSEIIVEHAIDFMESSTEKDKPFFAVIWDGSPHRPFKALEKDMKGFENLDVKSRNHYGELVAFDRSVGKLRRKLRELGIAKNTLVWYCSDNGGLGDVKPTSVGELRGFKGSLYEGGIRVPAIIEWPGLIEPAISQYPASTMDIFPTIADMLDLPDSVILNPTDGRSIEPLLQGNRPSNDKAIPFRYRNSGALIDGDFKLFVKDIKLDSFMLYNLAEDPAEIKDVSLEYPDKFNQLKATFREYNASIENSIAGLDYPEKQVTDSSRRHFWMNDPRYEPYLDEWVKRWEYKERIERGR